MKKKYLSFIFMVLIAKANGQASWQLSTIVPTGFTTNTSHTGWGASIECFSKPIPIIGKSQKINKKEFGYAPLNIQFGGNLYFASMGSKKFYDVPLQLPETENATVSFNNYLLEINPTVRLSSGLCKGAVVTYVEGFSGFGYSSSGMSISPYDATYKQTNSDLCSAAAFNMGVAGGAMFTVAEGVRINLGATWSHSEMSGSSVDLNSIQLQGNTLDVTTVDAPTDYLILKAGLCIDVDEAYSNSGGEHYGHGHSLWLGHCGHIGGGGHSHVNIHIHA